MPVTDEEDPLDRFRTMYSSGDEAVFEAIERDVIGVVYRANGYTTQAHADEIARGLELKPGHRLLDIGAGCGWPSLYLAETTGCEVVMTDPVIQGLPVAMDRGRRDGLADRTAATVASGTALPFRPRCFDAAVHTDVLC